MALIIEYEDPDLGFVDITGYVKWGEGGIRLTMTAEQGTVNTDSITVEDPNGIFNFRGLRNFSVKESESEFERIYIGWTWVKHVSRGDYYRTGPGRVWELELQDINHRLYQNVMAGNDTTRPQETDVERIQWLLTTGEASGFTDTTTYVFTDRPVNMDANPDPGYNGQYFNQVMDDCAQQSGKNYYVIDIFDDYLGYKLGIWYGHDDVDAFVSEATISNVLSEVDNVTVFWADIPAKLDRDPSRVYSGVFANFDGGWTYRSRLATIEEFVHRDTVANWPNIKTTGTANARADRMLIDLAADGEEDAVTVTIYSLLPSQANVFRAGHRVNNVKFSHFPGWESGRDVRIVRKTIIDQSEQFYTVELDLLPIGSSSTPSCSTQNPPIILADVWTNITSASHGHVAPFEDQPATPPAYPCVVIDAWGGGDGYTVTHAVQLSASGFSPSTTPSGPSPYTELFNIWSSPINLFAGYIALTDGEVPPVFAYVTDASCDGGAYVSFSLQTSATAPVQVGVQTGATIVFPSAPTPGNMIVMHRLVSTNQAGTDSVPELTGWTRAITVDGSPAPGGTGGGLPWGGIAGGCTSVWTRCVQPGDTDTYDVGASALPYFMSASEWELT